MYLHLVDLDVKCNICGAHSDCFLIIKASMRLLPDIGLTSGGFCIDDFDLVRSVCGRNASQSTFEDCLTSIVMTE